MNINGKNIYMRHTDKNGHTHVMEHRVWDEDLFVTIQGKDARENGGSAVVITRQQYEGERK